MKNILSRVWNKIRLAVIILLSIAIGASYAIAIPEYQELRKEADTVWAGHLIRQESKHAEEAEAPEEVDEISIQEDEAVESASPSEIEKIIYDVAKQKQFKDPGLLVRIAKAEASLDPCARNPHSSATGLYQILDMHGLTVEERCDPRIATAWTIEKINAGGISAWNESRHKWDI